MLLVEIIAGRETPIAHSASQPESHTLRQSPIGEIPLQRFTRVAVTGQFVTGPARHPPSIPESTGSSRKSLDQASQSASQPLAGSLVPLACLHQRGWFEFLLRSLPLVLPSFTGQRELGGYSPTY